MLMSGIFVRLHYIHLCISLFVSTYVYVYTLTAFVVRIIFGSALISVAVL